jgi:hypothetical protein
MAFTFNPFTGKLDYYQPAAAAGAAQFGGIYKVANGETLTIDVGRVLYEYHLCTVDGILIINGILQPL